MEGMTGEHTLVRIYVGESDKHDGKPSYQAILEMLRREKIRGATVLRGIAGFGAHSHLHTANILRLSQDLPIVIEIVETKENIDKVLPAVQEIAASGIITTEKVQVIRYGE